MTGGSWQTAIGKGWMMRITKQPAHLDCRCFHPRQAMDPGLAPNQPRTESGFDKVFYEQAFTHNNAVDNEPASSTIASSFGIRCPYNWPL